MEEDDDNFGLLANEKDPDNIEDSTRLNDAILDREKFKYGYWEGWRF